MPREFFTPESMLTLAGAAGITFVVCNGLQKQFNFNPRWLALAISEVLVLAGTASTGTTRLIDYLVAVINGFLVFLTAVGGTGAAGSGSDAHSVANGPAAPMPSAAVTEAPPVPPKRRFLSPWF